ADPSELSRPGHALEQEEQEHRIQRALSRLSPEHRAVLILKDMEGQKYETMAEMLQVPIGTVRSRLHRARLELRELLEKDEGAGKAQGQSPMLRARHRELLPAYVDGELSNRQRRQFLRLLHRSPEARVLLRQMQRDAKALRDLPRPRLPGDL